MAEYILFEYKRRRIWEIAERVILPRRLSVSRHVYKHRRRSTATPNRRTLFFNDFHKAFISFQVLGYTFPLVPKYFSFTLEKRNIILFTRIHIYIYMYIIRYTCSFFFFLFIYSVFPRRRGRILYAYTFRNDGNPARH